MKRACLLWMLIALMSRSTVGENAAAHPNPSESSDRVSGTSASALEARAIGIDGHPPERSVITFWRSVDAAEDFEVQPASSWRKQLNPATVWVDQAGGKTWKPVRHFGTSDRATVTDLVAGEYRMTASLQQYDRLPAIGVSPPVRLDGTTTQTSVVVQLEDGPSLTVIAVADDSGEPIDAAQALLVREDGLTVTRWSGWPWACWMREGRILYEHLAPGRYLLSVGRIPRSYGTPDYAPEQSPIPVVVTEGQDQTLTLRLRAVELTRQEVEDRWPYVITGHVRNAQGKGMAGAAVTAHIGMGTLVEGGCVQSGADGSYTLRFPAFGKEMFVVVVGPRKPGFFEKDLYRQGQLLPLWTDHVPERTWGRPPHRWIIAKTPYTLDFVMLPAVQIHGKLLDGSGRPMRLRRISVTGPVLPPASSVFASTETDDAGVFEFDGLPTLAILRFELSDQDAAEARFPEPGRHGIVIQRHYDPEGRPQLQLLRVNE
jgi:hypothetical protein